MNDLFYSKCYYKTNSTFSELSCAVQFEFQSNGQLFPIYEVGAKKFVAIKGILEMIWE